MGRPGPPRPVHLSSEALALVALAGDASPPPLFAAAPLSSVCLTASASWGSSASPDAGLPSIASSQVLLIWSCTQLRCAPLFPGFSQQTGIDLFCQRRLVASWMDSSWVSTSSSTEPVSAAELDLPEPEEIGTTFVDNADLKARQAADLSGLPALADDSGLCVEALDNRPGIFSARWAIDGNALTHSKAAGSGMPPSPIARPIDDSSQCSNLWILNGAALR